MKSRVYYFEKQLDFLLTHVVSCIVIVVLLIIGLCALFVTPFRLLLESAVSLLSLSTGALGIDVIAALIPILIASFFTALAVRLKSMKKASLLIKRRVYTVLKRVHDRESANECTKSFLSHLINVLFVGEIHPLSSQSEAIRSLHAALENSDPSQTSLLWIIGPEFSGKTMVVTQLLIELVTKKKYLELYQRIDRRIHYCDVSRNTFDVDGLIDELNSGKLSGHLLIVDNLHKVSAQNALRLICAIPNDELFAAIVTSRYPKDFLDQDCQIDALDSIVKQYGERIELRPFSIPETTARKTVVDERIVALRNEHFLFYFSNLVRSEASERYLESFSAFVAGESQSKDAESVFIALSAACVFTGNASLETMNDLCKPKDVTKDLKALSEAGFIHQAPDRESNCYLFHESIARSVMKRTFAKHRNDYERCFRILLEKAKEPTASKYFYSRLLLQDERDRQLDIVFGISNYNSLLNGLRFTCELQNEIKTKYCREFGIIYDRLGELAEATSAYETYFKKTSSADALLKIVQVDHTVYYAHQNDIERFATSSDAYSRLLAGYWVLHMDMHAGSFSFDRFAELLDDWRDCVEEVLVKEPYSGIHLLRRTYFDYIRTYYLCGILDPEKLLHLDDEPIRANLEKLKEFKAYYSKFVYGHMLHYDVLFKFGALGEAPSEKEISYVFGRESQTAYRIADKAIQSIARAALQHYSEAISYMDRVGDKTSYFVRCRYMEVKETLGEYEEAEAFYESFEAFARREGNAYYLGCAALYKAKLYLIMRFDPRRLTNSAESGLLEDSISKSLSEAEIQFKYADETNVYIDVHLELYQAIFNYISHGPLHENKDNAARGKFLRSLARIKSTCESKGYNREIRLIENLCESPETLSFMKLKAAVTYYPFVAQ